MKEKSLYIDICSYKAALFACKNYHYSGSISSARNIYFGVWEYGKFKGAVVFGIGATKDINTPYKLRRNEVCELTRVALKEHDTPVTKILSICINKLKKYTPDIKLIVSYADANRGHIGGIYKGGNWIYVGSYGGEVGVYFKGKVTHRRTITSKYGCSSKEFLKSIDPNAKVITGKKKFKYLYPLDKAVKKDIIKLSKPYPKASVV